VREVAERGAEKEHYLSGWYPTPDGNGERYWDGDQWTDQFRGVEPEYAISPVGIGLALVGALAMVIGVFLPRVESSAFTLGGIQENTLIQSGDGWIFIGLAAGIAGAVYRSWQAGRRSWAVLVMAAIAIGLAIYEGTDEDSLTLYRLDQSGDPNFLGGSVKATPAVGIYVVGAGGALALFGGWQMRRDAVPRQSRESEAAAPGSTKQCPECAESVMAAARVCKHCGYRFAPAATEASA
jgi:hypothetical protein